ncbi:hypothetical protein OIU78_016194 [Salix suchowensis]|nr:hypothetical protein OIU78_016194 [Salix suchowensis]
MRHFDPSTIWQGRHIPFVSSIIAMDRPFLPNDPKVLIVDEYQSRPAAIPGCIARCRDTAGAVLVDDGIVIGHHLARRCTVAKPSFLVFCSHHAVYCPGKQPLATWCLVGVALKFRARFSGLQTDVLAQVEDRFGNIYPISPIQEPNPPG